MSKGIMMIRSKTKVRYQSSQLYFALVFIIFGTVITLWELVKW